MTQSDLFKGARDQCMNPKEYRALSKPHKHRAKAGYYCLDCFLPYQKPVDKKLKCACGGVIAYFGSKLEQRYWVKFKLMEKSVAITDLKRQVRFPIVINGKTVGHYVADYTFYEKKKLHVLDAKGQEIEAQKFRRKCAEACNDIEVEIVR